MTSEITGPVLRWYGGKWLLAPWIISHFPKHRVYVEPFAGGASVLLAKPRSFAEVYNDLNSDVVNLFRVLRDPEAAADLIRLLDLTPFARDEFMLAQEQCGTSIERARRLIISSYMGFGSDGGGGWSRGFSDSKVQRWAAYPQCLVAVAQRLKGVVIENRGGIDCLHQHDTLETLHYIDPPYFPDARQTLGVYKHELTQSDHAKLLECICQLKGMVVLSGYRSEVYDAALSKWRRVEKVNYDNRANSRTEVLWINPAAVAALDQNLQSRFALVKP